MDEAAIENPRAPRTHGKSAPGSALVDGLRILENIGQCSNGQGCQLEVSYDGLVAIGFSGEQRRCDGEHRWEVGPCSKSRNEGFGTLGWDAVSLRRISSLEERVNGQNNSRS